MKRHRILFVFSIFLCSVAMGASDPTNPTTPTVQRMILLSPNQVEIAFALGLGDHVVGVSDYTQWPPEALDKPKVGGYLNPSLERIIALKPDVVVGTPPAREVLDKLETAGIKTLALPNETIEDVYASTLRLGEVTGRRAEAQALVENLKSRLAAIRKRLENLPRKRVLCLVGRNPGTLQDMYAAGHGTFLNDLLEAAGSENVLDPSLAWYPKISKEKLIETDPDIILDASFTEIDDSALMEESRQAWKQLPSLKAVRNNQVIFVMNKALTISGPRMPDSVEYLARLIHPEAFESPALHDAPTSTP